MPFDDSVYDRDSGYDYNSSAVTSNQRRILGNQAFRQFSKYVWECMLRDRRESGAGEVMFEEEFLMLRATVIERDIYADRGPTGRRVRAQQIARDILVVWNREFRWVVTTGTRIKVSVWAGEHPTVLTNVVAWTPPSSTRDVSAEMFRELASLNKSKPKPRKLGEVAVEETILDFEEK